jgi:hypothetical protein
MMNIFVAVLQTAASGKVDNHFVLYHKIHILDLEDIGRVVTPVKGLKYL